MSRAHPIARSLILAFTLPVLSATPALAQTTIGEWKPKFKGIDFSLSSNIPAAGTLSHQQIVYALRVDLADPDIRLFTTPRLVNGYLSGSSEVAGRTVSTFLGTYHLQAAINANFFDATLYYLPTGTPMDIAGLAISEGVMVSRPELAYSAALTFDMNNRPTISTSWPAAPTNGVYTAIAGNYPLLRRGQNLAPDFMTDVEPRTAFGLSEDQRYLFLVAIDGRQPGYSDGATLWETGEWLRFLGASDGINLDGGGSTTLVMADSNGAPLRLNHPSAVADSGRERTIASHFGIFAKPLVPITNDVTTSSFITNRVFDVTNAWKFTTSNLDGIDWKSQGFDDSGWSGPGPGLLWADSRTAGTLPDVQPKNTELDIDATTGFPFPTYYFRTHFQAPSIRPKSILMFSALIDDGAVFYLNGTEIYRVRMPAETSSTTLATGYPCEGDATCLDQFVVPIDGVPLRAGENLLAVEVHNYNSRSGDITFGLALSLIEPNSQPIRLNIARNNEKIVLSWEESGYTLQAAIRLEGPWNDLEAVSPIEIRPLEAARFFRLRQ